MPEKKNSAARNSRPRGPRQLSAPKTGKESSFPQLIDSFASLDSGKITEKLSKETRIEKINTELFPKNEEGKRSKRNKFFGANKKNSKNTAKVLEDPAEAANEKAKKVPEKKRNKKNTQSKKQEPVKIIPLGGLGEIGKNMTVIEYKNDIIIIDCGLAFPEDEMLGIDLVIPDFTYVIKNKDKVRGIVITHGHEDHIGSLSYLLKEVNVPVYSARLTIGLVEGKLKEAGILAESKLNVIKAGDKVKLGSMTVEFINVNHSIPDSCALAIKTPVGTLIHTGDFKIDLTPVDGVMIDLARFGELGNKGVLALMSDSTNAERPGSTPSERNVGSTFETLFQRAGDRRIIIASFSSNIHRIQQIFDVAERYNRKVVVSGRSMENVVSIAKDMGYLKFKPDTMVEIDKARSIPDSDVVIITTGSQGEPMSALTRMARGEHRKISVTQHDFIIISATPIPGNEKLVGKVINDLMQMGCEVIYEDTMGIHVSGHARRDEIKTIIGLTKPKYFIPVHGEFKHLAKNRELAVEMGIPYENIVVSDIGKVIELTENSVKMQTSVPAGAVMVDGSGVGDVGSVVLKDRKALSEDGLVVATVVLNHKTGEILAGPEVVSRGFVYVKESGELLDGAKDVCRQAIISASEKGREYANIKLAIKEQLGSYFFSKTKRRPVIVSVVHDVKI